MNTPKQEQRDCENSYMAGNNLTVHQRVVKRPSASRILVVLMAAFTFGFICCWKFAAPLERVNDAVATGFYLASITFFIGAGMCFTAIVMMDFLDLAEDARKYLIKRLFK
jgi:hypothetical protein